MLYNFQRVVYSVTIAPSSVYYNCHVTYVSRTYKLLCNSIMWAHYKRMMTNECKFITTLIELDDVDLTFCYSYVIN